MRKLVHNLWRPVQSLHCSNVNTYWRTSYKFNFTIQFPYRYTITITYSIKMLCPAIFFDSYSLNPLLFKLPCSAIMFHMARALVVKRSYCFPFIMHIPGEKIIHATDLFFYVIFYMHYNVNTILNAKNLFIYFVNVITLMYMSSHTSLAIYDNSNILHTTTQNIFKYIIFLS